MSRPPSSDDKRNGKRAINTSGRNSNASGNGPSSGTASTPKKPSPPQTRTTQHLLSHRLPTCPDPAHIFDADELPMSKSHRKMTRMRELRERREEQETVLQLIDSMRYGGEPNLLNGNRAPGTTPGKSARIAAGGFRVHWARLKRRLGTGSAPSESLVENSGETSDSSRSVLRLTLGKNQQVADEEDEAAEVDEVVVDNVLGTVTSQPSEQGEAGQGSGRPELQGIKSQTNSFGTTETHYTGFWGSNSALRFFRWTAWPIIDDFFRGNFVEEKLEKEYRRELWWSGKTLALYSSAFFLIHWFLILGLSARPYTLSDKIFFYGIGPLISIPLPLLVIFDYPFKGFKKQIIFQIYLSICVWAWSIYITSVMYACDFYEKRGPSHCGSRDFIGVLFFAVGLPTIALFGLRQSRIVDVIGFSIYFIISCALLLPEHSAYARNVIDALLFHIFLLYIHHRREKTERRNFSLRDQLKVQFKAAQKAQINERRANDSKRRLTSYVFHEVRVPLNTALLAVQNLEATNEICRVNEVEWSGLTGSLTTMSKVLNDVLDFDRLDSGRFSTLNKPYNLHQTMRSLLLPIGINAKARGLTLTEDLDKNIDRVARRAALAANGVDSATIASELAKSDECGIVLGDEQRLRQIVTNLGSNACKFTPAGGQIRIVTRLMFPLVPSTTTTEGTATTGETAVAFTGSSAPSLGAVAEKEKDQTDIVEKPAATGQKPVSETNPDSQHAKETEHSSLKSLKRARFLWRWPSRRKRANTVPNTNGESMHVRDMLDAAEKGELDLSSESAPAPVPLSTAQLVRHNSVDLNSLDRIVVRIEIHDTGVGIKPRDLVDNKLFSPYVQTEIGKYQGGKGTGLGLALVRRIVKLSGGRLGVKSKSGAGSTFWVELPFGIGKAITESKDRSDHHVDGSEYSEGQRLTALGPEDPKFARAISEGDTPSTLVTEQDGALTKEGDAKRCNVSTLHTKRALENVMDQRGMIEIAPPPLLRAGFGTPEFGQPPQTPFVAMLPTPPLSGSDADNPMAPTSGLNVPNENTVVEQKETQVTPDFSTSPPFLVSSQSAPGPLEASAASRPTNVVAPAIPSAIKGLRVLVVDDDPVTRTLMSRMLTRLGCLVTLAENGKVALEKILGGTIPPNIIRGEPGTGMGMSTGCPPVEIEPIPEERQVYLFDIVFLDNQMPVMSGLDTVTALRALGRKDFVVGVTGNALLSDQQEYIDVGVDEVLTKPVLESKIRAMLKEAARRRQKRLSQIREARLSTS